MKKASKTKTLNLVLGMATVAALLCGNVMAAGNLDPSKPTSPERANIEANQGKAEATKAKSRMAEVAQKLNISASELSAFFKAEINTGNKRAWSELLVMVTAKPKANATKEDLQHSALASQIVSSYINLRKANIVDNLTVRETDLVEIQKTWTITQKTNFAKVWARAEVLVASGKFNTKEDAFQQALSDTGYQAKYNSCNI